MREVKAGLVYFALVFAVGFVLGPLREALLVPVIGRTGGVVVEAPLMMVAMAAAAWWTCRRFAVPTALGVRAVVGAVAFATLLVAEAALAGPVRGWTLAQWVGHFATPEGLVSLALYLLFAAVPMLAAIIEKRRCDPPS